MDCLMVRPNCLEKSKESWMVSYSVKLNYLEKGMEIQNWMGKD